MTAVALAGLIALLVVGCKTDFEKQIQRWEECMSTEQITYEQALEVRNKNRPIIRRQPNYVGSGVYLIDVGDGVEAMGIIVYVSEIVEQSTLPEADRIGDCLEGIPVLFHLRGPLKLLGGPSNWHDYDSDTDGLRAGMHVSPYTDSDGGTITAIGTRGEGGSGGKFLVSAMHVFAGLDEDDEIRNPTGSEVLYHGNAATDQVTGEILDHSYIYATDDPDAPAGHVNNLDAAIASLKSGVVGKFTLHDDPVHRDNRRILYGAKPPRVSTEEDEFVVLGRKTVESAVTVQNVDYDTTLDDVFDFEDMIDVRFEDGFDTFLGGCKRRSNNGPCRRVMA